MSKSIIAPGMRLHMALVLISAALIGFQLEQMQLLAMIQWHHFAYLVISVALLGFGASGTCIALFRPFLLRNLDWLLPVLLFVCALLMACALPFSKGMIETFDIFFVVVEPVQSISLLLSQAIYLLVFFFGALPIGLVFIAHSHRINSLYSANLVGSGLGGVGAVFFMGFLWPLDLPAVTAFLPWAAGCLVATEVRRILVCSTGLLSLVGIVVLLVQPQQTRFSEYKDIRRILDIPGAAIVAAHPDPQGQVHLVRAPTLRYAPGLSLTYTKEIPEVSGVVLINGDWFGVVNDAPPRFYQATTTALPYAISMRERVLLLQAGTGAEITLAQEKGATTITAVEPHQKAARLSWSGFGLNSPFTNQEHQQEYVFVQPRTWLARNQTKYDLITLPVVGRFGGGSGLMALQEQYLLTKEAITEMWHSLSVKGVLQISTWVDTPSRNTLRLAATIREVLEEQGVNPALHTVALRSWNLVTFIVKRSKLTSGEIEQVRVFCNDLQFDPILLPGLQTEERQRYHTIADPDFFSNLDMLSSPSLRQILYAGYAFDIQPTSDGRPFFSQFLRWQSLPDLTRLFGERSVSFLELGYLVVLVSFLQATVAAIVLILLPLLHVGRSGDRMLQGWAVLYFGALGLGYMFFEIMLIYKLTLFFGHPLYAAAAGISSLLIFSGVGSRLSSWVSSQGVGLAPIALVAGILLLLYSRILSPLLSWAMVGSAVWKSIVFLLVITPPGIIMGMPFPLGLAQLAGQSKRQAAWAWGINGCSSVVSAGLATIVAVEFGFSVVLVMAGCAYVLAAVAALLKSQP